MNGEEMNMETKFGTSKTIKLRPEMRTLLVETSRCREVPYYNCYGSMLISQIVDKVYSFIYDFLEGSANLNLLTFCVNAVPQTMFDDYCTSKRIWKNSLL